jgi:hypothetical protein
MKKQNDTLWKGILEPFFYDFLLFVDPILAATVDQGREIVFMDKELSQESPSENEIYEQKIVDKLVRLHTLDTNKEWILLHLEIQEKYNKDFGKRMYNYFNRLYIKYNVPITAYAIFTKPNGIKRDNVFKVDCFGTTLRYTFNTYKIALQEETLLMEHHNPFALVVLIAKLGALKKIYKDRHEYDRMLLEQKIKIANLILEKQLPPEKERMLMNFLFYYVNFEFQKTKIKFDHEINLLTNKNIQDMTIEEILIGQARLQGKRQGEKKAKEDEVSRLIRKKGLTNEEIVDFAETSISLVKRVRKKIENIN